MADLLGVRYADVVRVLGTGWRRESAADGQDDGAEGLPEVTPAPLPKPECTPGSVTLTGADVAFRPDSDDFVDEAAAREALAPIAEQLVAAEGVTVTLTGTTVNMGGLSGQIGLSQDRAGAVLRLLARLGVPETSMTAEGVGSNFAGYVPDGSPDGPLEPAAAAQNRRVIVTPSRENVLTCP